MKIAIVTIATGKYDIFIPELFRSCEEFFLPTHDKKYFIFTDSEKIQDSESIIKIYQKKLGWPYDTMMRFHMFYSIKDRLLEFDYVFFMNANSKVVSTVNKSILETKNTCGIIATLHPGFIIYSNGSEIVYPLERNPLSSFYVQPGEERYYYQGFFNGGDSLSFLKMSEELMNLIDIDLQNSIIPKWHDESALNWYLNTRDPLILDPTFAYPEPNHEYVYIKTEIKSEGGSGGDKKFFNKRVPVHKHHPDLPPEPCECGDPHSHISNIFGPPKILQICKDKMGGVLELRK